MPRGWALKVNKQGFGSYGAAPHYDALVDCPVEMGLSGAAVSPACGIPTALWWPGAPSFDGTRLLADTQAICEAAIRFWHGDAKNDSKKPSKSGARAHLYDNYVFMLNAVADGYGGLEHATNSTALIAKRADLAASGIRSPGRGKQRQDGYTQLLGLISHEYFHTWNVKRLRPPNWPGTTTPENYTELLWFFFRGSPATTTICCCAARAD